MRDRRLAGIRLALAACVALAIPACSKDSSSNASAPSFGGVTSAQPGSSTGQITLTWNPAVDYAGGGITYLIFVTNAGSGQENLSSPSYATTNSTGYTLTGLVSANTYWIIVQAEDSNGSTDGNTIELSAVAK